MHSDVYKQIRAGVAAHKAYVSWMNTNDHSYYDKYIQLKSIMDQYVPDPNARF